MNTLVQIETAAAVRDYLAGLDSQDLQPSTIYQYRQTLKVFFDYLQEIPVSEESARLFFADLRTRGYASATIEKYYHGIKLFLKSQGINFQLTFHKHRRVSPYHSIEQIRALLEVAAKRGDNWRQLVNRDTLIIETLAYTGMRRAEILAMRCRDIDFINKTLQIHGKGDNDRIIPIHPAICDKLRRYTIGMATGDRVFPLSAGRIYRIIVTYAHEAGIRDLHVHSFRHFFATQLDEQKVSIKIIKDLLGHADISTTAIYLDTNPKRFESAVAKLPDLREE